MHTTVRWLKRRHDTSNLGHQKTSIKLKSFSAHAKATNHVNPQFDVVKPAKKSVSDLKIESRVVPSKARKKHSKLKESSNLLLYYCNKDN